MMGELAIGTFDAILRNGGDFGARPGKLRDWSPRSAWPSWKSNAF